MFARFLARLPSVRLERERDLARQAVEELTVRIMLIEHQRDELRLDRDRLQRRFDRLVEARLLKDGAITAPLSDPPPASSAPSAPALFANIGRLVDRRPSPATPDALDDNLDSIPAGATMRP